MTKAIQHHIPMSMMNDYVEGRLSFAQSMVVAAHISLCDECKAVVESHDLMGGLVMDNVAPSDVPEDMFDKILSASRVSAQTNRPHPIYPQAVM